ncbi:MAG: NADH:ubiquinone reductase (Na(+)-transporting) subunit C [Candidatus Azobacteroides sp.]|nr:NADH:ubiquinone reductase (Na(+)-transporting) subunit C [Candidatus Azobacteroides sp.]
MNKESNTYTIIYASGMVILVALLLAFTSQLLQKRQQQNEAIDKMRQILRSINIDIPKSQVKVTYEQLITDSFVIDSEGNQVEGNAFEINLDNELTKPEAERRFPVFIATINGDRKYILALRGAGLWGPMWGYISLKADRNTVYGADFEHAGETPGLGAEINRPEFGRQFIGKRIFNNEGKFVSIAIVRLGRSAIGQDYVDGISGGTITSQGVDAMLRTSIGAYNKFLTPTPKSPKGDLSE